VYLFIIILFWINIFNLPLIRHPFVLLCFAKNPPIIFKVHNKFQGKTKGVFFVFFLKGLFFSVDKIQWGGAAFWLDCFLPLFFFHSPLPSVKKDPVSSRFIIPGSNILFTAQLLFFLFSPLQHRRSLKVLLATYYLLLTICGEKQFQKKEKRGFLTFLKKWKFERVRPFHVWMNLIVFSSVRSFARFVRSFSPSF
jgi:hypothetical protein